jgi:molybdate transport system permease protein
VPASVLWVSLRAAALATLIVAVTGIGLGYVLAKGRFRGRGVIEAVCTLPMALPPTVVGYYLLTRLGGPGPVRDLSVRLLGHPLTFTFTGVVIAQSVESFPYCLRAARAAIAGADPRLEQALRAAGLPEWRVALQATLPLSRRGILAGVTMGFGRALGDYGATVAIAGKLPGTTTMPIALFDAVFDGRAAEARTLALVQTAAALVILVVAGRLGRPRTAERQPLSGRLVRS